MEKTTIYERLANLSRAEVVPTAEIGRIALDIHSAVEAQRVVDWLTGADGSFSTGTSLALGATAAQAGLGRNRHEVANKLKSAAKEKFGRF